jgi:hypothetical protein
VKRDFLRIKLDPERLDRFQNILAGQNTRHAGRGQRGLGIDIRNFGVGVGTADKGDRQHVGEYEVINVLGFPQ